MAGPSGTVNICSAAKTRAGKKAGHPELLEVPFPYLGKIISVTLSLIVPIRRLSPTMDNVTRDRALCLPERIGPTSL